MSVLDKLYDAVVLSAPVPGQKTVPELAREYVSKSSDLEAAIDLLIRWQCGKTAATGFVTGLPGLVALPLTVPADLAALWYVQMRMIAVIAEIYGLDSRDDSVRTLVYLSLLGSGAQSVLSELGAELGIKVTRGLIQKRISGQLLIRINKLVGFRLATKAGQKGVINLTKVVPVVGGVIGASINVAGTAAVGAAARKFLKPSAQVEGEADSEAALPAQVGH